MSSILTIDWDYFFNASLEDRNDFPDIFDGTVGSIPDNSLWYDCCIKNVRPDFSSITLLENGILSPKCNPVVGFFSENHGHMINVVKCIRNDYDYSELEVTNIDFHHDYSYSGSSPRCDNWVRLLKEKEPNTVLNWCKRPDSVTTSFGEDVCKVAPISVISFEKVIENLSNGVYDYIHICRSDLYAPPISDIWYEKICSKIIHKSKGCIKLEDTINRPNFILE